MFKRFVCSLTAAGIVLLSSVIYLAKQRNKEEPPGFETLNSRAMPGDSDPMAEASRRGRVLATARLTKELPAVQHELLHVQPQAGSELRAAADQDVVQPVAIEAKTTQMVFLEPEGMTIQWDVTEPGKFDSEPLTVPCRYSFRRAKVYRLKFSEIPGHEGAEIYPTLEIAPSTPRSAGYLAANGVPVELSAEDIDRVLSGKSVVKVIFLPNVADPDLPKGVATVVSSLLPPGLDPLREADRLGTILAIFRAGPSAADKTNIDE